MNTKMAMVKKRRIFETNELFIEEVRRYTFLYEKQHPDYKNPALKNRAWTAIGAIFGVSGAEAARKWKVQRDRYVKETKMVERGAGLDDCHKITWRLYPLMDEILRGVCKKENYDSWCVPQTMINIKEEYINDDEEECDSEVFHCSTVSPAIDIEETSFPARVSTPDCNSFEKPSTLKTEETPVDNATSKEVSDSLSTTTTTSSSSTLKTVTADSKSKQSVDKVECFCDYMKIRLRSLDKKDQYDAIRMLESIIQDFEGKDKYM